MGRIREPEVDLFFEPIHFGDLHIDAIAELDDAAGAAADHDAAVSIDVQSGSNHD